MTEAEPPDQAVVVDEDSLHARVLSLRPGGHVEAEQLEHEIAERMFGVSSTPARIDRFVILERLGAGGMGVVYSAYDPRLDRRVALKLLRDISRVGRVERERLIREAHALARISHPNVVTVHEVGQIGEEQVFVVMEFVVGQTLQQWRRSRSRSLGEILEVYRQAGRGLVAAHTAGLVHRDFKPQNAVVGDDGRVRVVDFGLARGKSGDDGDMLPSEGDTTSSRGDELATRAVDHPTPGAQGFGTPFGSSLTGTDVLLGTPAYMSPEQYVGRDVGPASDQFSFCVALYEALTGEHPFAAGSPVEQAIRIVEGDVREMAGRVRVPTWLLNTLRRGMSVRRDERYPSMQALLADLGRDPARARRRGLMGLAVTGLVGLWGYTMMPRPTESVPCQGGVQALADVWSEERRSALDTHLAGLPVPRVRAAGPRVLEQLDTYTSRWLSMHEDACLAHHRGEQSGALLDKRMMCLARRRAALDGTVELLSSIDEHAFDDAIFMIYELPSVHACGDLEELETERPVPDDPALAREVETVREGLQRVAPLATAGHLGQAHHDAMDWVERARALDYAPLLAEALLVRGTVEMDHSSDNGRGSSATLLEAFYTGLASHNDVIAAEASIRRIYLEAVRPDGNAPDDDDYALVRSLLERVPHATRLRALFLNNSGAVAASRYEFAAAHEHFRQALLIARDIPDTNPIELLETRFNLAMMSPDRVTQVAGLELVVEGLERQIGRSHYRTLDAKIILAQAVTDPRAIGLALPELCAELEQYYPTQLDRLTHCLFVEGTSAAERGDLRAAAALFGRIADMLEAPADAQLYQLQRGLSRGYARLYDGRAAEAVVELRQALAQIDAVPTPRWLSARVAELRAVTGAALLGDGQATEAVAELSTALELLGAISKARFDLPLERLTARTQRLLAQALLEADEPMSSHDPLALLDSAEAWYRDGAPGYASTLAHIEELRARLASR